MNPMWFETIGEAVIFAGAVAGAGAVLWKTVLKPLVARLKAEFTESVQEIVEAELETALSPIRAELEANGGNSVKDVVIATRDHVNDMQKQLEQAIAK